MIVRKGQLKADRFLVPYRNYGDASQYIVCVNGAQQTMASWKSVVSYFSKDYTLVLFDFPGQGRAQTISGPTAVSLDEQVRVLYQVLLAQNAPGKVNVVGASWGGVVVAVFAARHPELVDKIILASFGAMVSEKMMKVIRKGKELYENGKGDEVSDLIIENFGQQLPESYKKKISNQFSAIKKEKFRAFYTHGKLLETTQSLNKVVDLSNIKAETLVINGERDTIMDMEDVKIATAQIPNCETKIITGVGHFLHNEREDILDIYREFLSGETDPRSFKPNGKMSKVPL